MFLSRGMQLTETTGGRWTPDEIRIGGNSATERELFVPSECFWVGETFDVFVDEGNVAFWALDLVPDFVVEVVFNAFGETG